MKSRLIEKNKKNYALAVFIPKNPPLVNLSAIIAPRPKLSPRRLGAAFLITVLMSALVLVVFFIDLLYLLFSLSSFPMRSFNIVL